MNAPPYETSLMFGFFKTDFSILKREVRTRCGLKSSLLSVELRCKIILA